MTAHGRRSLYSAGMIFLAVIVAGLPWCRNHAYLRDFYDYGLVVSATTRIAAGEKPYVDFTTPIQAGFLGLNRLVEAAGGGTFLALTWGGAALIALMAATLVFMLGRRWPWWAAVTVGLAVTVASASQHTILWHNSLGVFALALVACAGALAPVLRRGDWPWQVAMFAGLLLGGMNKINYQLVAIAVALAWSWREGLAGRAGAGRVAATSAAVLGAGIVLPVGLELAWTGASPELWWRNVVQLAAAGRAEPLGQILSWKFLVAPIHDYYGPLLLPQAGLAGLVLCAGALAGCRAQRVAADRWLLPAAVLLAGAGAAGLLATNQEIAYLGLGAWLALITAVWLGFNGPARGAAFVAGLLLPAVIIGGAAWLSAWRGQRSQFGYSHAPRASYVSAEQAGPALHYLRGLRLPPEDVEIFARMGEWLPAAGPDGRRPVFYGAGVEWMERIWPAMRVRGRSLWAHWGTTYGPRETFRLMHELGTAGECQFVLTTLARDADWPDDARAILGQFYLRSLLGPSMVRWVRRDGWQLQCKDAVDFINRFGGNVAGTALRFEALPLAYLRYEHERWMLGVTQDEGRLQMTLPSYRFGADAVLERLPHAGPGPLRAHFKIIVHGATPETVRWEKDVELPAGEARVALPFMLDALAQRLELRVAVDAGSQGGVAAGYRNFQITHAVEGPAEPPDLRVDERLPVAADDAQTAALLGDTSWRPQQIFVTAARGAGPDGLDLAEGGEVWLHTPEMLADIRGRVIGVAEGTMARVVWYKGGRLQLMQQGHVPPGGTFQFHAWCGEPGGWFGILLDRGGPGARVRLTEATLRN